MSAIALAALAPARCCVCVQCAQPCSHRSSPLHPLADKAHKRMPKKRLQMLSPVPVLSPVSVACTFKPGRSPADITKAVDRYKNRKLPDMAPERTAPVRAERLKPSYQGPISTSALHVQKEAHITSRSACIAAWAKHPSPWLRA